MTSRAEQLRFFAELNDSDLLEIFSRSQHDLKVRKFFQSVTNLNWFWPKVFELFFDPSENFEVFFNTFRSLRLVCKQFHNIFSNEFMYKFLIKQLLPSDFKGTNPDLEIASMSSFKEDSLRNRLFPWFVRRMAIRIEKKFPDIFVHLNPKGSEISPFVLRPLSYFAGWTVTMLVKEQIHFRRGFAVSSVSGLLAESLENVKKNERGCRGSIWNETPEQFVCKANGGVELIDAINFLRLMGGKRKRGDPDSTLADKFHQLFANELSRRSSIDQNLFNFLNSLTRSQEQMFDRFVCYKKLGYKTVSQKTLFSIAINYN